MHFRTRFSHLELGFEPATFWLRPASLTSASDVALELQLKSSVWPTLFNKSSTSGETTYNVDKYTEQNSKHNSFTEFTVHIRKSVNLHKFIRP
jgi:hypothetical protein